MITFYHKNEFVVIIDNHELDVLFKTLIDSDQCPAGLGLG